MRSREWIALLDRTAARAAVRAKLREIPLPPDRAGPAVGDRVTVVTHPDAMAIGAATVARLRPAGRPVAHLRDRVITPPGHAVDVLRLVPRPQFAVAWTAERMAELVGGFLPLSPRDGERLGGAIHAQALAYGPPAKRPAHDRPRTPGRRALIAGRAASARSASARR